MPTRFVFPFGYNNSQTNSRHFIGKNSFTKEQRTGYWQSALLTACQPSDVGAKFPTSGGKVEVVALRQPRPVQGRNSFFEGFASSPKALRRCTRHESSQRDDSHLGTRQPRCVASNGHCVRSKVDTQRRFGDSHCPCVNLQRGDVNLQPASGSFRRGKGSHRCAVVNLQRGSGSSQTSDVKLQKAGVSFRMSDVSCDVNNRSHHRS